MLPHPQAEDLPAEERATPPCPHFGPCGGCQLQHMTYAAQLALKAAQMRAALEAAGTPLPELQVHASPPLAYRNRVRFTLGDVDGQLRAGYIRSAESAKLAASNFLPIRECPIAASILWRTTEALLGLLNGDTAAWLRGSLDQLELFTTADEQRVQITLYLRTSAKTLPPPLTSAFSALCERLRARVPELSGAGISLLPLLSAQRSRRAEQPRPGPAWGNPGLAYRAAGIDYWVPRGAFFQVNRSLLPDLLTLVAANRAGALAWDLYAGVGLFSRALAAAFTQVSAVEIAEPAATALASTGLRNLGVVKATTLDFLRAAVVGRDRPDFIVLDPPRAGAGAEVCALLARIAAPTLVYVSCSPETLPAELATLTASRYAVTGLHLFDLFPQTTHIETIAILTREAHAHA
jgi:23S rRNA (uracil1939-C5)-methyltransferase